MFSTSLNTRFVSVLIPAKLTSPAGSKLTKTEDVVASFEMMAHLIAKRGLISPLIHKDFPVRHPLLAHGNFASVTLNHQK
jgi:hypothetical protein